MWEFCVLSLFCYALLRVNSIFAIILKRNRKLFTLLLMPYRCIVTINFLWLPLMVPWVGLQCVIVVCPDHNCNAIQLNGEANCTYNYILNFNLALLLSAYYIIVEECACLLVNG